MAQHGILLMKFSRVEIKEIVKAWFLVSLIFAIAFGGIGSALLVVLPISLLTAGVGFVLHEIAHKYVAQRYKLWAEFRANNQMLFFGLLVSFLGVVLAAPGGVFVHGATREEHGKIAFAGPVMNIVLAAAFYGMTFVTGGIVQTIASYGVQINALLAVFNLIPFGPLDGASVWQWNKVAWVLGIASAAVLMVV